MKSNLFSLLVFFNTLFCFAQNNQTPVLSSCAKNDAVSQNRLFFTHQFQQLREEGFLGEIEEKSLALQSQFILKDFSFEQSVSWILENHFKSLFEKSEKQKISLTELKAFLIQIPGFISTEMNNKQLITGYANQASAKGPSNARLGGDDNTVQAACTNVDFATGTTAGWTGSYGAGSGSQTSVCTGGTFLGLCLGYTYYNNPNATGGFNTGATNTSANNAAGGVHTIMTGGMDPNVPISVVPPGGGNSIRLGNGIANYKAQKLRQTFTVAAGNPNFVYQYAVVLDDEGHSVADQPYFRIRMYNSSNALINCATYDVDATSASSIPGFSFQAVSSTRTYKYKNWSTVTVPLAAYIGQNVTIEFETSDCTQGAHFGYAYIQCLCAPIPITSSLPVVCNGQTTTLTAPSGAASYTWTGPGIISGTNTQTAIVNVGGSYTVNMTTFYSPPQVPCSYSQSISIGSAPGPATPNFNLNSICIGAPSTFTNTSSGSGISQYVWNFGDGSPSFTTTTLTNPVHTYTASGNYSVSLMVDNGCPATLTQPLSINPQPKSDFNAPNACLNVATNFSSTATPLASITSHIWDFGDGSAFSNAVNPVHTYTNPGTYNITYTVSNSSGCSDVQTHSLTISPNPVMAASANTVCLNLTTLFANTSYVASPDNITQWAWDFDNNGTTDNTAQFPTNTFTTVGTHTVELKAITNNGCRDSVLIPVVVNAIQTAVFSATNACVNAPVNIVNTTTVTPPAVILSYNWDFGPGATPATATGYNPPFPSYSTGGAKTITLSLTASPSCTTSLVQTVQVYAQPVANFSVSQVCFGNNSVFTDMSAPTGSITNWDWDFTNNGSIDATAANPTLLMPTSGTYSASLIVTDNNTCKDTVIKPYNVWGHAIVDFTPNAVCVNASTTFSNLTNISTNPNVGGVSGYAWNFGDGSPVDASVSPQHTYPTGVNGGTYTAVLTATTTNGCVDQISKTITVNALPVPSFSVASACLNSNLSFNNTSTIAAPSSISGSSWVFGVGSSTISSASYNPAGITYSISGIHVITLNLTSNNSCTATVSNTVEIYPQPVANFSTTSVCQSTATAFTDLSAPGGSITAWAWDYTNDGAVDNTTSSPTNIYAASGTYSASLIVTDNHTCKDTVVLPLNVWGHAIPDFSPNAVCFGTATTFTNLTNTVLNANVGGISSYSWDFADGTPVNSFVNATHTYTLGGNVNAAYNVTLTATTTHNCVDQIVKTVNLFAVPTASFTSDSVCFGLASHMVDASSGNGNGITNYEWDFSNNGSVDVTGLSNPNYVFPSIGNNPVSYTVSTNPTAGLTCKNTTNTLTVWVHPNPVADFTFQNKCINAQPNSFDGSSSSVSSGSISNYNWFYGDGNTGSGITSAHNYAVAQTYNATLTVVSNKGCSHTTVKQVKVHPKPSVQITSTNACSGKSMSFSVTPQAGSGNVTAWYWDFNNSINTIEANGQPASYVFPSAGQQTVALVTETDMGCRDTLTVVKFVDYLPVPQFSVNIPAGCPLPHCVVFTDLTPAVQAPANIVDWHWVFGDGTESHSPNNSSQSKCYNNSSSSQLATFNVKLIATTDKGCTDSVIKNNFITVYPKPIASYVVNPNPTSITEPLVYFQNQSQDYSTWVWSFGDGPNKDSINANPVHMYNDESANTYYSYLIVTNQYGCKDTAYVPVEVTPEFAFYIPNAFTPGNTDGVNDVFTGKGIGIEKYEMWIFDRWGEQIYYTEDIHRGWTGSVKGKDTDAKQDVYVWKVKIKDVLGRYHSYAGHVTLVK